MQEQEIEFLEEYKRVEAICCDMFSCDRGVSAYIEALEQAGPCERSFHRCISPGSPSVT